MSKISIITPFKNAEKYILKTARSVLSQSHQNWEWILINDHSEQSETAILKPFSADNRIQIIENKGKGIIDALKTAIRICTGDFITRMDADDLMPENKLSAMLNELLTTDAKVVTGKIKYFSDDTVISEGYKKYENWLNKCVDRQNFYQEIYRECSIASGNWLIQTKDLKEIGGFENLNYPEDYDLLFRFYQHKLKICGIQTVTHFWRDHPDRTSRNSINYQQKQFFHLKINRFLDLETFGKLILLGTGQKGRLVAKILLDRKIDFEWISHEAEKYNNGIFGKHIKATGSIINQTELTILNTTLIAKEQIESLFKNSSIESVILL